ncbi:MAG TPA: TrbI/VirB10 family protein [Candidatus Paceibacterota bacterium]|nr:TrbI/VirB10 family protein [Candidatus Paceibacterota bacterium]
MKPRDFLNFFKTKSGKLAAFGAVFAAGLVIFSVLRKQTTNDNGIKIASLSTNITGKPQVVQSVQRPLVVFRPPPPMSSSMAQSNSSIVTHSASSASLPLPQPRASSRQTETLAPISLFADSLAGMARPKKLSAIYAPFGRLIPCETVITVDSSSMETPIVGLITENVYYGGKLIIPAGTEVHGMAQTDRQRDRIATSTSWKLVWQDGEEMQLKAIALDREFDNNTNQSGWAITDGSAGLSGEVIKSDNLAEIKLFAATFLSGAASALTEQQQTLLGSMPAPTLGNAPFQGAQAVLQTYAQQIFDSIQKNGFYVRVPSGKQFYLYVLQTIDRADASFGGVGLTIENDGAITPKSKP